MAYLFSYKDIPVYSYDAELLGDRQWLNDTCISIAYRVFEEQYETEKNSVLLMDPTSISCLRLQIEDDDEYEGMATSLKVADYKWIVMPINDNQSFDSASSHWSVLLCHQPTFSFFYLDSHNKYNLSSAKSILPKISRLLQRR